MNTRDEFVALAENYRLEQRRRALIIIPLLLLTLIAFILFFEGLAHFLESHSLILGTLVVGLFFVLLGLNFYQVKSQESLARKCGMICPSCSRVFGSRLLKLVMSTHNCPFCGGQVFA